MFSKFIILLLKYFDLFGFCTEHAVLLHNKKSRNRHSIIAFIVHIIGVVSQCTILCYYIKHPIVKFGRIDSTNDAIKFVGAVLVYSSVIVESIMRRQSQQKIWQIYKKMKQLHGLQNEIQFKTFRHLLFKCFIYFAFSFSSGPRMIQHIETVSKIDQAHFWICLLLFNLFYETRILYYIFFIELLRGELKSIEGQVQEINKSNCHIDQWILKLRMIQRHYELLQSMVYYLNDVFGVSHFFIAMFGILQIVCEFNYMCWHFHSSLPFSYSRAKHFQLLFRKKYINFLILIDWTGWIFEKCTFLWLLFHGASQCREMV